MINREDMLELTRRMTVSRNCLTRVAGCYVDADGEFDGSFNINFQKLRVSEREKNLEFAKKIPFAKTNENLKQYRFERGDQPQASMWTLLMSLRNVGLKNDAMMDTFYDLVMEHYQAEGPYAIFLYHGSYDVPLKGKDKEYQGESEEVYQFLIGTISPQVADQEPGEPVCGFLFPAFTDRSTDIQHINVYQSDILRPHQELEKKILRCWG
ncbi:DUF4317 family protein [Hominifimenecus sp. rT4P-3]|uniref:DUF4317 family protein n=1 Tax=Hominifimenecus sp. rT4P-3 TaxID=3242979 RepID=UPI003DA3AD8E